MLDTHVLYWWTTDSGRISPAAARMIDGADEVAVASVSWYELAWMAQHGRVHTDQPVGAWLTELSRHARTAGLTPAVAATAVALPDSFPGDPADRQIYATAIENGWPLITKDTRMLDHPQPRQVAFW